MDISTVIGLILAVSLVLGSIIIGGGLGPFIDLPSLMITVGGSIAAVLINFQLKVALGTFSVIKKCFLVKIAAPEEVIAQFRDFATTARRDGLLALEDAVDNVDDEFLKRGMEQLVGGSSKDDLTAALETELACHRFTSCQRQEDSRRNGGCSSRIRHDWYADRLVQMLKTLDDPSKIGGGMAIALLTTLYGAIIANMFCIPLAGKLEVRAQEETMIRELMIAGLLSLVEGMPPRAVEERLLSQLSPKVREAAQKEAA